VIRLRNVNFKYGREGFSFSSGDLHIGQGENAVVIGPSGSGKTTLLNLVAGVLVPDSGSVEVAGVSVSEFSDAKRRAFRIQHIGFIFQDFALIEYLNVLDNIIHPYRISRAMSLQSTVLKRAQDLAGDMGIADKLVRFPGELSHGEKQRVAICRALVTEPALILADEATGNLDPENKDKIVKLLFQAVSERNATLLSVTHDHELLGRFDRVIDFRHFGQSKAA